MSRIILERKLGLATGHCATHKDIDIFAVEGLEDNVASEGRRFLCNCYLVISRYSIIHDHILKSHSYVPTNLAYYEWWSPW